MTLRTLADDGAPLLYCDTRRYLIIRGVSDVTSLSTGTPWYERRSNFSVKCSIFDVMLHVELHGGIKRLRNVQNLRK